MRLCRIADFINAHIDTGAVLASARVSMIFSDVVPRALPPPAQRIAIARDLAFSFLYPHILAGWRKAGADIVFFSPLANEPPPEDCDLLWLPGGYPELHAGRLAAAECFLKGLRRFAETKPAHGECGGYMVLGQSLIDQAGHADRMAGLPGAPLFCKTQAASRATGRRALPKPIPWARRAPCCTAMNFIMRRSRQRAKATCLSPLSMMRMAGREAEGSRRGKVTGSFFHVIAAKSPKAG